MKLHNRAPGFVTLLALLALGSLVLFSGCEDNQARSDASDATKAINELKAKLDTVMSENKELTQKINGLKDDVAKQIGERMDKLAEQVTKLNSDLQDKVGEEAKQIRSTAKNMTESAASQYEKELESAKTTIAGDVQKIREELKVTTDDLKKFMDNQLREVYPYAYQPKRMDAAAAPAETK